MNILLKWGESFESIMDDYFEAFKEKMNNRFRIPKKIVNNYQDDVCFMVDYDNVYIQVVKLRIV